MHQHSTILKTGHRKPKALITLSILALALSTAEAYAASFDCKLASTYSEKTICTNSQLSKLDEQLSALYKASISLSGTPESLKFQQREWIKKRNSCTNEPCISELHQSRIGELRNLITGEANQPVNIPREDQIATASENHDINIPKNKAVADEPTALDYLKAPIADQKLVSRREKIDLLSLGLKPSEKYIAGLWECSYDEYNSKSLERYGPGNRYESRSLNTNDVFVGTYRLTPDGNYLEKKFSPIRGSVQTESTQEISMPTNRDLFMLHNFSKAVCEFVDE